MERITILKRKRVIDLFKQLQNHPIVYVKGQAGKGKKYAVKQFLDETNTPYVWYNLSCAMRIKQIEEDIRNAAKNVEKTIVLDGLQYYEGEELEELLIQLIRSDDRLRFILLSRRPLSERFKVLMVESLLGYFRPEWLLYTRDEIIELFKINGVGIDLETANAILQDTDGWVIVVSVVLQKMKVHKKYTKEVQEEVMVTVSEYLDDRVLRYLTDQEKRFLYKTSLLDSFTLELANYILRIDNSDTVIQHLNRIGNFVKENHGSYYYLSVYKTYFYQKCISLKSKNGIMETYRLAGEFLQKQRNMEAIKYYIQAGAIREAANMLEKEFYIKHDFEWYYSLDQYLSLLPNEEIEQSSVLIAAKVLIEMIYWRESSYQYWLEAAYRLQSRYPSKSEVRMEMDHVLDTLELLHPGSQNLKIIKTLKALSEANQVNRLLYNVPVVWYQCRFVNDVRLNK